MLYGPSHEIPGGFGWYFLAHTQHDFLEVIQVSDLTGAFGVSFVIAAVNSVLFEVLYARAWFQRLAYGTSEGAEPMSRRSLLVNALSVAGLLFAVLGYGRWQLTRQTQTEGPTVALVQTNLDQRLRNLASNPDEAEAGQEAREKQASHFARLFLLARGAGPSLIVFPETSYPGGWAELIEGTPSEASAEAARRVAASRLFVLIGVNATVGGDGRDRRYNSAVLLGPAGFVGRYDKIHLVPFGEYTPFVRYLPFLRWFVPYDFDYAVVPGTNMTRFTIGEHTFGVLICYEDTLPNLGSPFLRGGDKPVDYLLNISNDGWFDGHAEHDQHLAICRFRAVEYRRSIGRSVNMGLSAMIDADGRVLRPRVARETDQDCLWEIAPGESLPVGEWRRFKQVSGVIVGRVPIDTRESLYARFGDWFAGGLALLVAVALVIRRKGAKP
jgi:apolipoprotein N-acyltransferase